MLEGEKQALLTQVMQHTEATERKLRALGLKYIKVGLYDERTRGPIHAPDQLIEMAEGKCPLCRQVVSQFEGKHAEGCTFGQPSAAPEGGEPAEPRGSDAV